MDSNTTSMTAQAISQIPFGFGMSACDHTGAFGAVVRDRETVVTGLIGYAQKSTPGAPAWRPPLS